VLTAQINPKTTAIFYFHNISVMFRRWHWNFGSKHCDCFRIRVQHWQVAGQTQQYNTQPCQVNLDAPLGCYQF